jgi:hypothetical protein
MPSRLRDSPPGPLGRLKAGDHNRLWVVAWPTTIGCGGGVVMGQSIVWWLGQLILGPGRQWLVGRCAKRRVRHPLAVL